MPRTRAASRRLPDAWTGGVLEAISQHVDEATLLRMTMLSASIRREMSEPSFKLQTGLCWSIRLDFALEKDFDAIPKMCVREGRRRWPLVMPFMRYAGEVCGRLMVFDDDVEPSYDNFIAVCSMCPHLQKLTLLTSASNISWTSQRVRRIAQACPLLQSVLLDGLLLPSLLTHFASLHVINIGNEDMDHHEEQLTRASDGAVCRFLKRRRNCTPGITLSFDETYCCPSNAMIRAAGGAPIRKVSIFSCDVDAEQTNRLLSACTSLQTLRVADDMDCMEYVTACPSITYLELVAVDVNYGLLSGLTCLSQLETLKLQDLRRNLLSQEAADVLLNPANFPRLVELELNVWHGSQVNGSDVFQRMVDTRPALRILTVDSSCFNFDYDADIEDFLGLPFMATLKARGGGFRFEDPSAWDPDVQDD